MTDNKKIYYVFSSWITICIVILMVTDLPLLFRGLVVLNIFGCLTIMRFVYHAEEYPDDMEEETEPCQIDATSDIYKENKTLPSTETDDLSEQQKEDNQ